MKFAAQKTLYFALALMAWAPAHADEFADVSKLAKAGKVAEALTKTNEYLSKHPADAQMRFMKGVLLSEQNKSEEAIAVFTRLTEDYKDLPEPYNNLAVLYAANGQYDKARVALEKAIRTNPSYQTAYENLGDIYGKMASQAYDKALALGATAPPPGKSKLTMLRTFSASTGAPAPAPQVAAAAVTLPAPAPTPAPAAAKLLPAPAPAPLKVAAAPAPVPAPPPAAVKPAPQVPAPAPAPAPIRIAAAPVPTPAPAPAPVKAAPSAPLPTSAPVKVAVAPAPPAPLPTPAPIKVAPASAPTPAPTTALASAPAPAAPPVKTVPPKPDTSERDAVLAQVHGWAKAWAAQNVDSYLGYYSQQFEPPKGLSRKAWADERRARIEGKGRIHVEVAAPEVTVNGNTARVTFRQTYESDRLTARSRKTLVMVKNGGKWQIKQEVSN